MGTSSSRRLIEALGAGQEVGGDRRRGRLQSAAVIVADPREVAPDVPRAHSKYQCL
ncbi:MAG: hypothetical protein Ct9H300mP15_10710 [Gemmatimonadota bacterium]|nr:MAG: hypothetical protein Ct9H300mP15_10710 [Gemmatimonadota bacterium]